MFSCTLPSVNLQLTLIWEEHNKITWFRDLELDKEREKVNVYYLQGHMPGL